MMQIYKKSTICKKKPSTQARNQGANSAQLEDCWICAGAEPEHNRNTTGAKSGSKAGGQREDSGKTTRAQPEDNQGAAGGQPERSRRTAGAQPERSRSAAGGQPEDSRRTAGAQPERSRSGHPAQGEKTGNSRSGHPAQGKKTARAQTRRTRQGDAKKTPVILYGGSAARDPQTHTETTQNTRPERRDERHPPRDEKKTTEGRKNHPGTKDTRPGTNGTRPGTKKGNHPGARGRARTEEREQPRNGTPQGDARAPPLKNGNSHEKEPPGRARHLAPGWFPFPSHRRGWVYDDGAHNRWKSYLSTGTPYRLRKYFSRCPRRTHSNAVFFHNSSMAGFT